jgi:type II secretory pathway pseudopilin PulG
MTNYNKQKNKASNFIKSYSTCLKFSPKKSKGFTIIEAMIAIFILSVSVVSMLGITATSASYARYANNEITANYLLQEAVDSIRNSRDTIAFQMKSDIINGGWDNFLKRYGYPNSKCFSASGCDLMIEHFNSKDLTGGDICVSGSINCTALNYHPDGGTNLYYNHSFVTGDGDSIFTRKIIMKYVRADEVKVTASISWQNMAGVSNTKTQTLETSLLNWQK